MGKILTSLLNKPLLRPQRKISVFIFCFLIAIVFLFQNCSSDSSTKSTNTSAPSPSDTHATQLPDKPVLSYSPQPIKIFHFSWAAVNNATFYKITESSDGISTFSVISGADNLTSLSFDHVIPIYKRLNAKYILQACNTSGCTSSDEVIISTSLLPMIGYLKASNCESNDHFGGLLALSGDGKTLAISSYNESSNSTSINGDQSNNLAVNSGAVYVFTLINNVWSQQAYIKASNAEDSDRFGFSVALSEDGNTLAVGAFGEDSNAVGINGSQSDNSSPVSGAAYVFVRSSGSWTQQAYIKASDSQSSMRFGDSIALSSDGNTMAVGAGNAESVYIFIRTSSTWSQQSIIKASNYAASGDEFGYSLALSRDGNTLAVGAYLEDSNSTGIGGNESNNLATDSGAVFVFTRSGTVWTKQAYIKPSNTQSGDSFGQSLTLSSNGDTLAISAPNEDSNAVGINGDQNNNGAASSGAVYVFKRFGAFWTQEAYLKASNTNSNDLFGYSLSLSSDGNTLAVSAVGEASVSTGINGDQNNNTAPNAGAAYLFTRSGSNWQQETYIKASNTASADSFGIAVSLSSGGESLAIGADYEQSNATGIGGNQYNNSSPAAGAAYLY